MKKMKTVTVFKTDFRRKERGSTSALLRAVVLILLLFSITLLFGACVAEERIDPESMTSSSGEVDGEIITSAETDFFKARLKTKLMSEYARKYDIPVDEDFWETEIDGSTPGEELEKRAFDEAKRAKRILILCREKGIYDEISWDALKKRAEQYNADHSGGAVGLRKIDMETFYLYYVENGRLELEGSMTSEEIEKYIGN